MTAVATNERQLFVDVQEAGRLVLQLTTTVAQKSGSLACAALLGKSSKLTMLRARQGCLHVNARLAIEASMMV